MTAFDGDTAMLSMRVSAGFYVRSLAHDLGEALGWGRAGGPAPHPAGEFDLSQAPCPLDELVRRGRRGALDRLVPFDGLLPGLPAVALSAEAAEFGQERPGRGSWRPARPCPSPLPDLTRLLGAGRPAGGPGQTRQNTGLFARLRRFRLTGLRPNTLGFAEAGILG